MTWVESVKRKTFARTGNDVRFPYRGFFFFPGANAGWYLRWPSQGSWSSTGPSRRSRQHALQEVLHARWGRHCGQSQHWARRWESLFFRVATDARRYIFLRHWTNLQPGRQDRLSGFSWNLWNASSLHSWESPGHFLFKLNFSGMCIVSFIIPLYSKDRSSGPLVFTHFDHVTIHLASLTWWID